MYLLRVLLLGVHCAQHYALHGVVHCVRIPPDSYYLSVTALYRTFSAHVLRTVRRFQAPSRSDGKYPNNLAIYVS